MTFDGSKIVLLVSIVGFLITIFTYYLGIDIKKHCRRKQRMTFRERLRIAIKKRWK